MKIAFIGAGNMASAMIGGLIDRGLPQTDILAIDPNDAARVRCAEQFGIEASSAIDTQLRDYDAIVLAVKPQILKNACIELAPMLRAQLVVSIAAGIRIWDLSRWMGGYSRIVRAMPNTPALIGKGIAGVFAANGVDDGGRMIASRVLEAVGTTVWLDDEAQLDAVTAVSGSGPAYVFYFLEAMQAAAVELGLSNEQGSALAIATFSGATALVSHSDVSIGTLRDRVTSKGGTTASALASFAMDDIKAAIIRGAMAAKIRARELGDEFGAM